jgi:hypothetical protein
LLPLFKKEKKGKKRNKKKIQQSALIYLTMYENHRTQEPPRAALAIDVKHPQDLQEPDASDGGSGKDLAIASH